MMRSHARLLPLLIGLALPGCAHRAAMVEAPAPPALRGVNEVESPRATDASTGNTGRPAAREFAAIHFGYDSAQLTPEAMAILDDHLRILRTDPALRVVIEGHCDERGTAEYNVALGERRAEAVRAWLRDAGVKDERLRIVSYGKERPFATGHAEEDWRQNRRAQLVAESR